jgi:hypothetical protein
MSSQARKKPIVSAHKRLTKRKRRMTDKESSDLLESAGQALAMVQGSKLVGGRLSVRQATAAPQPCGKKDMVEN